MENISELFNKVHTLNPTENNNLSQISPNDIFTSEKWFHSIFQSMKSELNSVKSLLNDFNITEWSYHTKKRDPSSLIIPQLKSNYRPELLTQAWCKFYECLSQFPIINPNYLENNQLFSVHLCEAPGAFISALNHYLAVNYPDLKWDWLGNTLNPNYEGNELNQMIPDDRLIKFTLDHWYFGDDFTGDITKYPNHLGLVEKLKKDQIKVHLVTADGSVDCMQSPGEQEIFVEYLHYCESMTALAILQKGGSFVLKIFTTFEASTICLLYLLLQLFEKVSIFKPCSSKSGNSETYVINLNYRGFDRIQTIWPALIAPFKNGSFNGKAMFPLNKVIPSGFLKDLEKCARFFMGMQIRKIQDNIAHFGLQKSRKNNNKVHYLKVCVAKQYLSKCKINFSNRRLVPDKDLIKEWRNFNKIFYKHFRYFKAENLVPENVDLSLKYGKKIEFVANSKFMPKELLDRFQQQKKLLYNKNNNFSLYNLIVNKLNCTNLILNIKDFNYCYKSKYYSEFQRDLFDKIYEAQNDARNIIFIGIPFHTHFLVGLLYILLSFYENMHISNNLLILSNKKHNKNKQIFNDIKTSISNKNVDLVQLVNPTELESNQAFFKIVCSFNKNIVDLLK